MSSTLTRNTDLGFEPQTARANLVAFLLDQGVVSQEQFTKWTDNWRTPIDIDAARKTLEQSAVIPRDQIDALLEVSRAENSRRAAASDEAFAWATAAMMANIHAPFHGIPYQTDSEPPQPRCDVSPCRVSGASFALLELHTLACEETAPARGIADDLAELARQLHHLAPQVANLQNAIDLENQRDAELAKRLRIAEAPWNDCITVLRIVEPLANLIDGLTARVRDRLSSNELRLARPGTRGRPKNWALTALWQHLAKSGFSHREIAELVPDNNLIRGDEARIDRVRKRVAEPDCRSLRPGIPDRVSPSNQDGTTGPGGK